MNELICQLYSDYFLIIHTIEALLLFNANSAMLQLYHGENRFIFNEMMSSALDVQCGFKIEEL